VARTLPSKIKVDQSLQVFLAQRAVGSGFKAVLFTDVRTSDDARTCVEAVRPETPGSKGIYGSINRRNAGCVAEVGSPDYITSLHDIVVAVMIEKKPAVENLEDILSVEGLDMVQFGPGDYPMSSGTTRQDPAVQKVEERVIKTALDSAVAPRAEIMWAADAEKYIEWGIRNFSLGIDVRVLYNYLATEGGRLRAKLQ